MQLLNPIANDLLGMFDEIVRNAESVLRRSAGEEKRRQAWLAQDEDEGRAREDKDEGLRRGRGAGERCARSGPLCAPQRQGRGRARRGRAVALGLCTRAAAAWHTERGFASVACCVCTGGSRGEAGRGSRAGRHQDHEDEESRERLRPLWVSISSLCWTLCDWRGYLALYVMEQAGHHTESPYKRACSISYTWARLGFFVGLIILSCFFGLPGDDAAKVMTRQR